MSLIRIWYMYIMCKNGLLIIVIFSAEKGGDQFRRQSSKGVFICLGTVSSLFFLRTFIYFKNICIQGKAGIMC